MSDPDLDAALREAVSRQLKVTPEQLSAESDLGTLGLDDDSIAFSVLEAVEHVLDVRFPDDFLDGLRTYGQFTSAVRVAVGA